MSWIQDKQEVAPQNLDLSFRNLKIMQPQQVVSISLSLQEYGQKAPLKVAKQSNKLVLLDGFKRQLAAAGMQWESVTIEVIAPSIAEGLLYTLQNSLHHKLHLLEESKFVKYLLDIENYTAKQLGLALDKSTGWVSNRKNFCDDVPTIILEKIFKGQLPSSSYVCVFKRFIQKWEVSHEDLEKLIKVLSGKDLKIRELEDLTTAYFTCGEKIVQEILRGNLQKVLSILRPNKKLPLTKSEEKVIRKLEHLSLQISSWLESYEKMSLQSELTPSFMASYSLLTSSFDKINIKFNQQLAKIKRVLT